MTRVLWFGVFGHVEGSGGAVRDSEQHVIYRIHLG